MLREPEKECPECKGLLGWKTVRGVFSEPLFNGYCKKCNLILRGRETPDLKKGRLMAGDLIDVKVMDKKITKHNGDVQLGILRAKMHCATCNRPHYGADPPEDKCLCTACKCPYCKIQERKS